MLFENGIEKGTRLKMKMDDKKENAVMQLSIPERKEPQEISLLLQKITSIATAKIKYSPSCFFSPSCRVTISLSNSLCSYQTFKEAIEAVIREMTGVDKNESVSCRV